MEFKVSIIGRVGRDADLRETSTGKKVCSYSVATNPSKDKTVWVTVTTWDKRAEIDAQYVKKGMLIKCDGVLQTDESGKQRTYEKDGVQFVTNYEMTAYDVKYLSKADVPQQEQLANVEEEIPF